MSRQAKHEMPSKDQGEPGSGGDRSKKVGGSRSKQSSDQYLQRKSYSRSDQDSSGHKYSSRIKGNFSQRTREHSNHSKEHKYSDEEIDEEPKDTECISSESQSRSHPSQLSTDRSKSFSQIYSEIFEESKERQQKAERACRTYCINASKLHRSFEASGSRGPGSGNYESSLESECSSNWEREYREYESSSIEEPDFDGQRRHQKDFKSKPIKGPSNKTEPRERFCCELNQGSRNSYSYPSDNRYSEDTSKAKQKARSCVCALESSVCSLCSACSRSRKYHSEGYRTEVTDGSDYPGDCRSVIPTTATSQSRSQRDYLSSCSTRHRHHHYCRQRSEPKTYQDRGNSPINIKTRRKTHDYQGIPSETGSAKVRVRDSLSSSRASIGVQYPSEDETEDWADEGSGGCRYSTHGANECESLKDSWSSDKEENASGVNVVHSDYDESLMLPGDSNLQDIDINDDYRKPTNEDGRSVNTEAACHICNDLDQFVSDDELSSPDGIKEYDNADEQDDGYSHEPEMYDENEKLSDENEKGSSEEGNQLSKDQGHLVCVDGEQPLSHQDGANASSKKVDKSKSFLSLKIYNADEALMEIPENFKGPAIILDDDADFLDITLTDDEEKIHAKLMAAALTTRKSTSSISANSSLRSRRSLSPCMLNYKPSVIFTRRSEVVKDESVPRRTDRVALLAEEFLRRLSENSARNSEWQPLVKEDCATDSNEQNLEEEGDSPEEYIHTPPCDDRQLLSKEFNRKLQRQLKVIVETFQ
ncbi:uncharacterized protein LOC108114935 [Drosophila eugracilis]|uniref:uncharacterized protein LOC108114935 n=1 Tax=Drosophila eugracilis TaxID=29029 RepID=UPI001BD9CD01|nr:uncharacterized protein LOC108114935 [Drosophila eugracilis]